jgi:hypothetical protein
LLIKVDDCNGAKIEEGGGKIVLSSDHFGIASSPVHPIQTAAQLFLNGNVLELRLSRLNTA